MKKIGIVGATGYTGSELVRILVNHPEVEIEFITSETHTGEKFSDIHSQFKNICDMELISVDDVNLDNIELIFLALPHGVSMEFVKKFAESNVRIIDFSGDFRLSSKDVYDEWYKKEHSYPKGFENAVFGIPELFADEIKKSRLIANPGCFPTGAILAIAPLILEKIINTENIIVDSKTGVTGAGVKPKLVTHFPNLNDNFKPYGLKKHRHTIEIEEQLSKVAMKEVKIQFTPHLLPVDRGILTSVYLKPNKKINENELKNIYKEFYGGNTFIRIIDKEPEIKNVRGTNYVDIFPVYDERTNNIMVFSAIDNLVKGAAGQAVQNMNILLGFKEETGLTLVPVKP
jgi:N-acetyl-gamma-glutamyl-phosphate reductase